MAHRTRALLALTPLTLLLAGSPLAHAAPGPATAGATAPAPLPRGAFTTTTLSFRVPVGPATAPRTCTVDADLRIPAGASPSSPAPAMLMSNGFGGSKTDGGPNGNGAYAARFAEQGYVTLSYSALGFGGSNDCDITIDDPLIDGRAGSALVSFLGGDPTVAVTSGGTPYLSRPPVVHDATDHDGVAQTYDPRVGMIGGSYGGQIQFAVAGIDHRVDALAPIYTWNQLEYSLAPNNAAPVGPTVPTPGAAKYQWQNLFGALGEAQLANRPPGTTNPACPATRTEVCRANADSEAPGYPSTATQDFFGSVSVGDYVDRIVVPTLFSQGQNDTLFDLQEAIATYRSLEARGVPTRMVWQSWGHSGSTPVPGELDPGTTAAGTGTLDQTVQGRIFLDWFAHWLRDEPTDLGPAVRYFRDYAYTAPTGTDPASRYLAAEAAYGSGAAYPVGPSQALRLSGGSALVPEGVPVTAGSQTFDQPGGNAGTSYSETSALGTLHAPSDAPGTFAAWSTAALTAPIDVAGVPTLTVRISAPAAAAAQAGGPAGQLVLFAKLYDVAPDGSTSLVHGLISPVRVADVTRPVTIELPGIVHRYAVGHALRLVLAAGDSAYHGNVLATPVTITDDPAAPAVLTLPLAAAAAPGPVVPEVPVPALLPVAALALLGCAVLARRRTRSA